MTQTIEQLQARVRELEEENARLRFALADTEALELGTSERLAASQAYAQQLREALENHSGNYTLTKAECKVINDLLDQPTKTSALDAYVAENESLQKDAARLDWVEHQDFYDLSFAVLVAQPNDGMIAVSIGEGWHLGNNLREAIDAAMAQGEQK